MYIVQMMDTFATSLPLLFVALSECVVISYVYGQCALRTLRHGIELHYCYCSVCLHKQKAQLRIVAGVKRFSSDIQAMMGFRPNYYWLGCWGFCTPILLLVSVSQSVFVPSA